MINKLSSIWQGWVNSLNFDNVKPDLKKAFMKRLDICSSCPHMTESSTYNRLPAGNNEEIISKKKYKCSLCGCRTVAKISSPKESCPDNPKRWERITVKNGIVTDDGIPPQKI